MMATRQQFTSQAVGASAPAPSVAASLFPGTQRPGFGLPKAGGSIRSISPTFNINRVTATADLSLPLPLSESRPGPLSKPQLSLSYSSGGSNGTFGYGWHLGLEAIQRKQSNRIPSYTDDDVFQLDGEDLVPRLDKKDLTRNGYIIRSFYRCTESAYDRVERWSSLTDPSDTFWRRITGDNVTTVFGDSGLSRVSDPADPTKTLRWLTSASWDTAGNAILYEYVKEGSANVDVSSLCESTRHPADRTANRYLSSVSYGNRVPSRSGEDFTAFHPRTLAPDQWMFKMVLDYGGYGSTQGWGCRRDAFSVYSAGFEIRTYRLCQRILMFHNFPSFVKAELPGFLVSSMSFSYSSSPLGTFLSSAAITGHSPISEPDGKYTGMQESKTAPPVTFTYSTPSPVSDYLAQSAGPEAIGSYPSSSASSGQWLDFYGTGVPGLLSKQTDTLYWRENYSPLKDTVTLSDPHAIYKIPDDSLLSVLPELGDVDGRGRPALMMDQGFIAQSEPGHWEEYRPFSQAAQFDSSHPQNLVHLDLTGDGLADMLFVADGDFMWSQSLGIEGHGPIQRVSFMGTEEAGKTLLLGYTEQPSLFLADMSGDGLLDLVNVQNGRIEYFPNLGYGAFGRKIAMDHAPWFDDPDHFLSSSIRFTDVDGNGTQDIIYLLRGGGANLYRNLSGNALATGESIPALPSVNSSGRVDTIDLLGKGTGCLVWTSSLPGYDHDIQYIDLSPAGKPNLMVSYNNGLGLETFMEYVSSTKFFLKDRLVGRDWVTQLAFPVQCLQKVVTYDNVTQAKRTQRFQYRHGFWDMFEREFRGFGFVETWDGEDISTASLDHLKLPVSSVAGGITHTKSWFHTALEVEQERLDRIYKSEFCPSSTATSDLAHQLENLATPDLRGVYRALTGHALRQEIYGVGPGESSDVPYSMTESTYSAVVVQSYSAAHSPAVVRIDAEQSTNTVMEQDTSTPRISHSLVLELDLWGNVLRSISISYGMLASASGNTLPRIVLDAWSKTSAVLTVNHYTNTVEDEEDDFRHAVLFEQTSYEVQVPDSVSSLSPLTPTSSPVLEWRAFKDDVNSSEPDYRLLSRSRSLFRGKDMEPLPSGKLDTVGIPLATYKLTFLPAMLHDLYLDGTRSLLEGNNADTGGYENLDSDGSLWISGGRQLYAQHGVSSEEELHAARTSFFAPVSFLDSFGAVSTVEYDENHLCVVASVDAVGNKAGSLVDYRVLKPWKTTDINDNVTETAFDALGTPVATALLGPAASDATLLNSLDSIAVELNEDTILTFLAQPTTESALNLLKGASSRSVYRLGPDGIVQVLITREQDSVLDEADKVQIAMRYSSGSHAEVQTKTLYGGESGSPATWLSSGWVIPDHRGTVVKQYEPFFDSLPTLNRNTDTVCTGVSLLDPLGRPVIALGANGLWSKTERSAWTTTSRDFGDLVDEDLFADPIAAEKLLGLGVSPRAMWKSTASQIAVQKSQVYLDTPHRTHLDPLGREICTEMMGSDGKSLFSFNETDVQGRVASVFDEVGRQVASYEYDLVGRCCKRNLMDTGSSWTFFDAAGAASITWTPRRAKIVTTYDLLRRPTAKTVIQSPGDAPQVVERLVYGDADGLPESSNLRGKVHKAFDRAGVVINEAFDPRGELLSSTRQHALDFKGVVDWTDLNGPALNPAIYRSLREFDALGRQRTYTAPDESVQSFGYSQGGQLQTLTVVSSAHDNGNASSVVTGTEYNARGQQTLLRYGNGVTTMREYDKLSFLCTRLTSTDARGRVLQDLNYDFDCMSKIITIDDKAQQDAYFRNTIVSPRSEYAYDHLERLVSAAGREQIGRKGAASPTLAARSKTSLLTDSATMTNYTEAYTYDDAGNMLRMAHVSDLSSAGWTRNFSHAEPSLLEPEKRGNRLTSTAIGSSTENYGYGGESGSESCMTKMPGFSHVAYDFLDQMVGSARQVVSDGSTPETTYYVYNAAGKRVRKVTEAATTQEGDGSPTILKEILYLDGLDVATTYQAGRSAKQRNSLQISAGNSTVAIRESLSEADSPAQPRLRFQLASHLPSVSIELDDEGNVLSYEEYSPFGSTTLLATAAELKVPKRYRFSGKELDAESGLSYFGRRYFCAAAARWTTADPLGLADGLNMWAYVGDDPVNGMDPAGLTRVDAVAYPPTPGVPPPPPTRAPQIGHEPDHAQQQKLAKVASSRSAAALASSSSLRDPNRGGEPKRFSWWQKGLVMGAVSALSHGAGRAFKATNPAAYEAAGPEIRGLFQGGIEKLAAAAQIGMNAAKSAQVRPAAKAGLFALGIGVTLGAGVVFKQGGKALSAGVKEGAVDWAEGKIKDIWSAYPQPSGASAPFADLKVAQGRGLARVPARDKDEMEPMEPHERGVLGARALGAEYLLDPPGHDRLGGMGLRAAAPAGPAFGHLEALAGLDPSTRLTGNTPLGALLGLR